MLKLFKLILSKRIKVAFMIVLSLLSVLGTLYIPTLTASIVNNGILKGDINYIWKIGGLMAFVAVITSLVSILRTYISSYLASLLGKNVRDSIFRKVQEFSLNDFNEFGTPSLITRCTSDVNVIQQSFSYIVEMLLPAPFMAVAGLVLAFSKDKMLSFLIIGTMILVIIFLFLIGKKSIPYFGKMQKILDKMNNALRENITGVRVIRAFNRFEDEKIKVDDTFTKYADTAIKANKIFALALPLIMLIMNLSSVLIIWFGGQKVASGSLQIGDIMSIIAYSSITLMYLVMAGMVFIMIPRAQTSAKRIHDVLNHTPEFTAVNAGNENELINTKKDKPILEFKDVCFKYQGAEEATLENINFQLKAGETLAIIGSTGSGKSSIAKLIMKFYNIANGEIIVNGKNIKSISDKKLRDKIGYVPQKAFLFSGTIADNLKHGKKNATLEEMKKACRIAQADDFISHLDSGYESFVSQAGNNFSGGQKQRLSIARAIVKNPDIYIFDDSFSALDFKTDAKLREALKEETRDSAVIIIAQRVTTIMNANKILVLDEGKMVGLGNHKELLEKCEVYKQIAMSQLSEEEL